jgi:hypothetical protein
MMKFALMIEGVQERAAQMESMPRGGSFVEVIVEPG